MGAFSVADDRVTLVVGRVFLPGEDVVIGSDPAASLSIPDWNAPPFLLITGNGGLYLAAGMRVNMCDARGSARLVGTFEELQAAGEAMPIEISMRGMNIRVRKGLSVFAKYLAPDEPEFPPEWPPNVGE